MSAPDLFRYQTVEQQVAELIESGAMAPGDRLPSLRAMARRAGASITTVNQAYVELERKGLIESRPRSGFFVRQGPSQLEPPSASAARPAPRSVNRSRLIETVLKALGNADLLPFGVICPTKEVLPTKALARIMGQVVRARPGEALEYAPVQGLLDLRRQIALRAMSGGASYGPDDLVITNGAMEALCIALMCITRPGDTVLIQSPTYYCFLQLIENLGLRALEIPSHPERGIDPADVADALERYDVRACAFSSNYNNPDGAIIPDEAKREIVHLLGSRNIPLVEDDVSGDLYFGSQRPSTMKSFDRDGLVILCSSFSKTLCPGHRMGWMTPGRFLHKALEVKATTTVCGATPTQMAVAEYLGQGMYEKHLARLRPAIASTKDIMRNRIAQHFPPGTRATDPQGGAVLWLELPGVDAVDYFYEAKERGISTAPGPIFSTVDKYTSHVRLSCGGLWSDELDAGLAELGRLAASMA